MAKSQVDKEFGKNVIDPFSALFEMSGFNLKPSEWVTSEKTRQAQKTLQNHIGDFHQQVLGNISGWENLGTGNVVDLVNHQLKVIAELKNKHNTVSGGKLADVYHDLESLVMPKTNIYKGYKAYYVTVIPSSPERFNKPFTPSDKNKGAKCNENELIRHIDGASFYALATGSETALADLFKALPLVIEQCSQGKYKFSSTSELNNYFDKAFG